MWNRTTLRIKVTLLTTLALVLVTVCITWLSNYNARQNIVNPVINIARTTAVAVDGIDADVYITETIIKTEGLSQELWMSTYVAVTSAILESQNNFQVYSIVIAVVFVLIGAVGAYFISGRALGPIKSLAEKIEVIDEHSLDEELELPNSNDEVSRLTYSFNNMLGKLNRSFEMQKLFAQNAAHELKTPLASIRANIEVLQLDDKPSVDEYKEVVDVVKDSTEQLISIVEGLLSINSVTDESAWKSFDARAAFVKILGELHEDILKKNLAVSLLGDCRIKGDEALLERAFSNLVHNAVRYNVENGEINISLADDNIIIEDSGVGIPAGNFAHIFEPFYCVDQSRSKDLGGNGLGLAIAKNIFDKHRMEVSISSLLGKETKIIIKHNFKDPQKS